MFKQTGKALQAISLGTFIIETVAAVISGVAVMAMEDPLIGLSIVFGGVIAALFSALLLNGFGKIVENAEEQIALRNSNMSVNRSQQAPAKAKAPAPKIVPSKVVHKFDETAEPDTELKELLDKGLISIDQYWERVEALEKEEAQKKNK